MIKKREICLYCQEKMESKTAKKKFCSDKCKVYWHRENGLTKSINSEKRERDKKKKEQIGNDKWKEGDPSEGSGGFFLKFGAFSYDDENFKRN